MSGPRIAPGSRADVGFVNSLILKVAARATGGTPPNLFSTLARSRGLFRRWLWFAAGLMPGGKLPRADTELVILRVASNTGSDYERRQHESIAPRTGLSPDQISATTGAVDGFRWTPRQELLLRATDELHAERNISDGLWTRLAAEFSERELIELCMLVGHYEMLAMTLNALEVQTDEVQAGEGSAPGLGRR